MLMFSVAKGAEHARGDACVRAHADAYGRDLGNAVVAIDGAGADLFADRAPKSLGLPRSLHGVQ